MASLLRQKLEIGNYIGITAERAIDFVDEAMQQIVFGYMTTLCYLFN